jgi:hypothetical protein
MKLGKKGKADAKNRLYLNKLFTKLGIDYCERCGSRIRLTFAHRFTRQHCNTVDEMRHVARICLKCHMEIEGTPTMTEEVDRLIDSRDDRMTQAA